MSALRFFFAHRFNRLEFYSCAWLLYAFSQGYIPAFALFALVAVAIVVSAIGEAALRHAEAA